MSPARCLPDGGLRQLAKLLVCNFRALEHGYGEEDILQTLRDLPIIPLADGRVVALNREGVFFPMEETKTRKKDAEAQKGDFPYMDVVGILECAFLHAFIFLCRSLLQKTAFK